MVVFDIVAFILGACVGSFLNVLIIRLPLGQDIIFQRSQCTSCQKILSWYHLIPIVSALLLKFRCGYCHQSFSKQYCVVEILTATLTLLLVQKIGLSWQLLWVLFLFFTLIVLVFIDFKYKAVPDYLLLIALVMVFIVQHEDILEALKNALLFTGAFALLEFVVTFYIQNIKARLLKDEDLKQMKSLGEGDIPIVAIIGALLGVSSGLFAIFLAAFFAIIPSLYQSFRKKDTQTPFIPYLLLGLAVEYLYEISKVFS